METSSEPYIYISERCDYCDCTEYDKSSPYFDPYSDCCCDDLDDWLISEGDYELEGSDGPIEYFSDEPISLIDRLLGQVSKQSGLGMALNILYYVHHLMVSQVRGSSTRPSPPWPGWYWASDSACSSHTRAPWANPYDAIPF